MGKIIMKEPKWFEYRVVSFNANDTEEINKCLIDKGLDASDIISIIEDLGHDFVYKVFCKEKIYNYERDTHSSKN
jgi:hypothetical protein